MWKRMKDYIAQLGEHPTAAKKMEEEVVWHGWSELITVQEMGI